MATTTLTVLFLLASACSPAASFLTRPTRFLRSNPTQKEELGLSTPVTTTGYSKMDTRRSVWWFGGSESVEPTDDDSCELVAVRIERTSANSRRIFGEITVAQPLDDVWAILTDYDNLATHVPNLMESKVLQKGIGQAGDGSYKCKLFQKGAQKIVGFDFSASVTMNMKESVYSETARGIGFVCADSFFFSQFDGLWKAQERINQETGEPETLLSYSVDVRPKGPVPVAALEWRIREDVPTNLRAVKKAAMSVGYEGVVAANGGRAGLPARQEKRAVLMKPVKVQWFKDETMAAYLTDH